MVGYNKHRHDDHHAAGAQERIADSPSQGSRHTQVTSSIASRVPTPAEGAAMRPRTETLSDCARSRSHPRPDRSRVRPCGPRNSRTRLRMCPVHPPMQGLGAAAQSWSRNPCNCPTRRGLATSTVVVDGLWHSGCGMSECHAIAPSVDRPLQTTWSVRVDRRAGETS
jgi:hypothetical protein